MLQKIQNNTATAVKSGFGEAAKGFFRGNFLPGVYTYSSPDFEGDIVDGAGLFIKFTKTPVYYPKRNEEDLIPRAAHLVLNLAPYFNLLADIGCGTAFSAKAKHLLGDADYGALDSNEEYLEDVECQCNDAFPEKTVHLRQSDFMADPIEFPGIPFPVMLGATITNFGTPDSVKHIFRQLRPIMEQGNGSFVFTHDTNTNIPSLTETYTHEYIAQATLNVLHRMKRDLQTENFDPHAFGFCGYWDASTSTFNLSMYPKKDMTFAIEGEWFSLKKDQILPQAPLMKLPAEVMLELAKSEGLDHYDPIFDQDHKVALQHVHL